MDILKGIINKISYWFLKNQIQIVEQKMCVSEEELMLTDNPTNIMNAHINTGALEIGKFLLSRGLIYVEQSTNILTRQHEINMKVKVIKPNKPKPWIKQ